MRNLFYIFLILPNLLIAQEWRKLGDISGSFSEALKFDETLFLNGQTIPTNKGIFKVNGNNAVNIFCKIKQTYTAKKIIEFNKKLVVYGNLEVCKLDSNLNKPNVLMAEWDGFNWEEIPIGTESIVINAMCVYKNELYVAGNFKDINGLLNVNRIARWDGNSWKKVGTGLNGGLATVETMCVYKNELYVAGNFSNAGGIQALNIARWDGANWYSLDKGCNGYMRSMIVNSVKNELIVAGEFEYVNNTIKTPGFAKWDGSNWSKMSNDRVFGVMDLAYYHNKLFVGSSIKCVLNSLDTLGYFYNYNESDSTWHNVLNGTNTTIWNLLNFGDSLILVGGFSKPFQGVVAYYESIVGINTSHNTNNKFFLKTMPNPASQNAVFEYEVNTNDAYLEITDLLGNELDRIKLLNKKDKINYFFNEQYSPGMYYISITVNKIKYNVQKLIVN